MDEVKGVHRALNDVHVVVVASSGSWLGLGVVVGVGIDFQ